MLKKFTFILVFLASVPTFGAIPEDGCGAFLANLIKGLDSARASLRDARNANDSAAIETQKAAIRYVLGELRTLKQLREELMEERVRNRPRPVDDTEMEHAESEGSYLRDERNRYGQGSDENPWGFEAPRKPMPASDIPRKPFDISEAQERDNRKLGRMNEYYKRPRALRTSTVNQVVLHRRAVADIRMAKGLEFEQLEELQAKCYSSDLWNLDRFSEMLAYDNVHAFVALDQYEQIMGYMVAFVGETKTIIFDSGVAPGFHWEKVLGVLLDHLHDMVTNATTHTTHISASFQSANHPLYKLLEKRHYESSLDDSLTLRLDF